MLVRDVEKSSAEYAAILGSRAVGSESARSFSLGRTWIEVREAIDPKETEHLERFGQGPYAITLWARSEGARPGDGELLDPALFSGAKIFVA